MNALIPLIQANPNATDAEIVAIAAVKNLRRVPIDEVRRIVPPVFAVPTLTIIGANASLPDAVRGVAITARELLTSSLFRVVDRTDPAENAAWEAAIPALLAIEVITEAQATALLALGNSQIIATEADVQAARATMAADAAKQNLLDQLDARVLAVQAQIRSGTATTWDEVRQAMGAE